MTAPFEVNQFAGFFDDAALFPPGNAPMARAVPEHRARRTGDTGVAVGPFIIGAGRLGELGSVLDSQDAPGEPIEVGLVVTGGAAGIGPALTRAATDRRLLVRAVEVAITAAGDPVRELDAVIAALDDRLPAGARGFIETGYLPSTLWAVHRLNGTGHWLKFRCGGLSPDLFPTTEQLAQALSAAATTRVPFKCTAGLHHAVRHTAPATGFEHFGFLNVLLAATLAGGESTIAELVALLDERDAATVAGRVRALGREGLAHGRRSFRSYGTCEIAEPLAELTELHLISYPQSANSSTTERREP